MTKIKEGYKDTEIGVIPVEWDVVELGNILTIQRGASPRPINKFITENENGISWIKIGDIQKNAKYLVKTKQKITNEGAKKSRAIKPKDFILSNSMSFGRPYISKINGCIHDGWLLLRNKDESNLSNNFLYEVLSSDLAKKQFKRFAAGSTVNNLKSETVITLKIPLPPLEEQKQIADILSTADDKIDAIAIGIEKAETLKKGLLQKLLSEGIGHSEFKDSELGEIPESWEVVELATITTILLSNVDKKSKDDEQDVKLCNYMDVYNNQYITNDLVYMEATAKDNQIEKFQLQINDVIITKDSETKDDIAIPAVVMETFQNLLCGYHLAVLRPKEKILYGVYLMKVIQSITVHKHFEKLANGITRFGLTSSAINQALIPLPPLKEQKQIADILSTADEKLEVLRAKKQMYQTLKIGLLQKLLSGELRV